MSLSSAMLTLRHLIETYSEKNNIMFLDTYQFQSSPYYFIEMCIGIFQGFKEVQFAYEKFCIRNSLSCQSQYRKLN